MYILNYRCDSGYEPTDTICESLAVSEDITKLEALKANLLKDSEEYDQKFGEWRTKKTKILKEYLVEQMFADAMHLGGSYSSTLWSSEREDLDKYFGFKAKNSQQYQYLAWIRRNIENPYMHELTSFSYANTGLILDKVTCPFPQIEKYPIPEKYYEKNGFTIEEIKVL